ncbi:tripartite tricarboxylate transporter permease [Vibrio hepatarius]|uniref:tripartite tricarboxylate transporter permease n=1 Tax=Vibrio hepatarius TaxID=171383 RepID=UPI00142E8F1D|nr:tripartite tricarboxylate transporter permease [Vibrio hepatarius]NIY83712.1 tripartite tricarboxylate transporter protein TctA [Vibrio hepatarius]
MYEIMFEGGDQFLTITVFLNVVLGTVLGLLVGVFPGLGPLMGMILLLPFAYQLPPVAGIGLLVAIFIGGSCGGAISAILLRIPGTPLAAATLLDGYPMAKKGRSADAIGIAISASALGGLIGGIMLIFFTPMLASVAMNFGPPEYFALSITGLLSITIVSSESTVRGLMSGCLGLLLATIGTDQLSMAERFTFGSSDLLSGLNIGSVVVGLFAISEVMIQVQSGDLNFKPKIEKVKVSFHSLMLVFKHKTNLVRSSVIGTFFGAIPGASGIISSFASYAVTRSLSKTPEEYGKGAEGGVVTTESSNNACCGGAMIPTLALAVSGGASCAVLMSALMLLGLQPGPQLFALSGDIVGGVFLSYLLSNVFLLLLGLLMTPLFVSVLKLKKSILLPIVLILSILGTFSLQSATFDLWVMLALGVVGYLLRQSGFPLAPIVIGFILGPIAEGNLRRSLLISQNGFGIFLERPIGTTILIVNLVLVIAAIVYYLINLQKRKVIYESN